VYEQVSMFGCKGKAQPQAKDNIEHSYLIRRRTESTCD
jgi:hypothetical protein